MKGRLVLKKRESKSNKGMEQLLKVHTQALENNSESIIEILELLSSKDLSAKDKKVLKDIKKELKGIDKTLDSLGKNTELNEEDWF